MLGSVFVCVYLYETDTTERSGGWLASLGPPRLRCLANQVVVEVFVDKPFGARTFARPRLPGVWIVVLCQNFLSLRLDEASGSQQLDFGDSVFLDVVGELVEFGLLFLLLGFFDK